MSGRTSRLREAIRLVGLLATACGGRLVTTDGSGSDAPPPPAPSTTAPPQADAGDDGCPHSVEVRGFDLTVDPSAACAIAASAPGCFGFYCQPAAEDCARFCRDPAVNACALPADYASAFKLAQKSDAGTTCPGASSPTLTLHCSVTEVRGTGGNGCPIAGRRPSSWCGDAGSALATPEAYLAECARLEAASVLAFRELAAELESLGAPSRLLAACLEAAVDEERHASLMSQLLGHDRPEVFPSPLPSAAPRAVFELATENAVEGVVREAFGAALTAWCARRATDPAFRAAMAEIAPDELRHAALAFEIGAFLDQKLEASEREEVRHARWAAIHGLRAAFADDPPESLRASVGVPNAAEAREIHAIFERTVWLAEG
jgi:hypothetical protein